MKLGRRALLAALIASPARSQAESPLRDLARRAAIYLTPPYEMYKRRHRDIVERGEKLNRLVRQLSADAGLLPAVGVARPSGEPLFLRCPHGGPLLQRCPARSFRQGFRCRRAAAPSADTPPPYMIVGPTWKGDVSSEVAPIYAPAPSMWLRLRIAATDDDEDLDVARGLQARTLLETPDQRNERRILEMRELMRSRTIAPPEPHRRLAGAASRRAVRSVRGRHAGVGRVPAAERTAPCSSAGLLAVCVEVASYGEPSARPSRRRYAAGIEQGHADIRAAAKHGPQAYGWA